MFSGAFHNKLLFLWCPLTENSSIQGLHKVSCFFAWRRKQSWLLKHHASLKNYITDRVQKKKTVSVNFSHAVFSILDFLRSGTDRLSQNIGTELQLHATQYSRTAQISHDDSVMQTLVWLQFEAIWFGVVQFGASCANLRWPHILKHQI